MEDLSKQIDEQLENNPTDPIEPQEGQTQEEQAEESALVLLNRTLGLDYNKDTFEGTLDDIVDYIKYANETAANNIYKTLEEEQPEIYQLLQLAYKGANVRELLTQYAEYERGDIFSYEVPQDNVNLQKQVITSYLKATNPVMSDMVINATLQNMEDSGLLYEEATKIHKYVNDQRNEQKMAFMQEQERKREQVLSVVTDHINKIDTAISSGKIGDFSIPKEDSEGFKEFLADNIGWTQDGVPFVAYTLDPSNLANEYYRYKKGDLSRIIQQQVKNQQVLKLQQKAKQQESNGSNKGLFSINPIR
jgi:hypothetical protein